MTKKVNSRFPQPIRRARRLVMDKVAERLQQQVEVSGLVIKELLDLMTQDEARAVEQAVISKRRKELLRKLEQIDFEYVDFATIAKLYKLIAEADGVDMNLNSGTGIDGVKTKRPDKSNR